MSRLGLTAEQIRLLRWLAAGEDARRRRQGHPRPQRLREVVRDLGELEALGAGVSVAGQCAGTCAPDSEQSRLSAAELAEVYQVSPRTITRNASRYGGRKVGPTWTFPNPNR